MKRLKLVFTGICLFVERDCQEEERMVAIFPDGRTPLAGYPHMSPMVLFDRNTLAVGCQRQPDLVRRKSRPVGVPDSACFLHDEDLWVETDPAGKITGPSYQCTPTCDTRKVPTLATWDSWAWVADLTAFSGFQSVDPLCFDSSPCPEVGIRFVFPGDKGRFATEEFLRPNDPHDGPLAIHRTRFDARNQNQDQVAEPEVRALFASCTLELDDDVQHVELHAKSRSDGHDRVFLFAPPADDDELKLEIWNVPMIDLLQAWGLDQPRPDEFGIGFQHHGRIWQTSISDPVVPVREETLTHYAVPLRIPTAKEGCIPARAGRVAFDRFW